MEGSDAFQETQIGEDDPFAGIEPADDPFGTDGEGDFEQDAPDASSSVEEAPTEPEKPKRVDREGKELTDEPSEAEQVAAEAAEALAEQEAEGVTPVTATSVDEPATEEDLAAAGEKATEALKGAVPSAEEEDLAAPKRAAKEAPKPAAAPKPNAKPRSTAKASKRQERSGYYLLVPDGDEGYKRISWNEDSKGNPVTTGGKETKVADCYSQREALQLGYRILEKDAENGVTLIAVPVSRFQPRRVKPKDTPIPLDIS